jgi:hypothetical protein
MLSAGLIIGYVLAATVGLILLFLLIDVGRKVVVVSKGTAMVIERFGKFHGVLYEVSREAAREREACARGGTAWHERLSDRARERR